MSASFVLGGLKQAVDALWEAVSLPRSHPGEDALEISADHLSDLLHRLELRGQYVTTPAVE